MIRSVVIPIKQLENAKQRLSGLLNASERQALFAAMVEDVLEVCTSCDLIDQVIVVTADAGVTELSLGYGARVLPEPAVGGLIEAVDYAAALLSAEGVDVMMFLPGDVPLVSIEELEVALSGLGQAQQAEFMIVPSHDLGGSNCVVASPPDCIKYAFGTDSFRRHLKLAREAGIEPMVAKLPGLGLDIDTPDDLIHLSETLEVSNLNTHTAKFLTSSGLAFTLKTLRATESREQLS